MVSRRTVIALGGTVTFTGMFGAGATGLVPGVSDVMGTSRPRDLGVTYTQADYRSGLEKIPGHTVRNAEYMCITCDYESRGSVPVDARFTQEEFTAQLNVLNSEKGPVDDVQVRFNQDGTVETSAYVSESLVNGPVYARGRIDDYSSRSVSVSVLEGELGRVGLNESQVEDATNLANELARDFIARNPGLRIDTLEIGSGDVVFTGTFPEVMEGDPDAEPDALF